MSIFSVPAKILTGEQALAEAAPFFRQMGARALVVTGRHTVTTPFFAELAAILKENGLTYTIYSDITGEPTISMVEEGVRAYRRADCDFLIGIGGGSPLDAAKAIAAMLTNPGRLSDYLGREITNPTPPIAAIPTTAGTGSEATRFTIITDEATDTKMLLKGDVLLPSLAVVDYRTSVTMPPALTAATGLDALTHAVEAYTSRRATPLTDTLAVSAVRRILTALPAAYRNPADTDARRELSLAALEAGICINNSSVTIVHGMSRPIGALFHVPHGLSNAMLLPVCLRGVMDGALSRFAALSRAAGCSADPSDGTAADALLQALEDVCRICEVPSFAAYGIAHEAFEAAIEKMSADAIASGSPANCHKTVTAADCARLYRAAWNAGQRETALFQGSK